MFHSSDFKFDLDPCHILYLIQSAPQPQLPELSPIKSCKFCRKVEKVEKGRIHSSHSFHRGENMMNAMNGSKLNWEMPWFVHFAMCVSEPTYFRNKILKSTVILCLFVWSDSLQFLSGLLLIQYNKLYWNDYWWQTRNCLGKQVD